MTILAFLLGFYFGGGVVYYLTELAADLDFDGEPLWQRALAWPVNLWADLTLWKG